MSHRYVASVPGCALSVALTTVLAASWVRMAFPVLC